MLQNSERSLSLLDHLPAHKLSHAGWIRRGPSVGNSEAGGGINSGLRALISTNSARTLCVGAAAILAAGCGMSYEPKPQVSRLDHQEVLSNTASVRNTYVFDRESPLMFCSEPPPDAAFSQTVGLNVSLSLLSLPMNPMKTGSDGNKESEGSAEMEMQGRTPMLMIARELLYRLCEFSKNHHIDQATAIDLYRRNLDMIRDVAIIEAKNSKVTISEKMTTNQSEGVNEAVGGKPAPRLPVIPSSAEVPSFDPAATATNGTDLTGTVDNGAQDDGTGKDAEGGSPDAGSTASGSQ